MPSGVEALQQMGLWPLPPSIPQRTLRCWSFHINGRDLFEAPEPMGSRESCALVDQGALLAWLLEMAGDRPGFRLLQGSAAVDLLIEPSGGRVEGVVLDDTSTLRADLVVACDGRASRLRDRAELPLRRDSSPIDVLWFRLQSPASDGIARWLDSRFLTAIGPSGSFALYESSVGGIQLGWALDPSEGGQAPEGGWLGRWVANAPAALACRMKDLPADSIEGPVRLPVQVALAERWQRPGLLLLGDAAHPMSPLRAQGLSMALRDAWVASRHLLPRLRSGAPDHTDLDAALAQIESCRRREIVILQRLQRHEADRADRIRRQGWLRQLLVRSRFWIGPLLAKRWMGEQQRLRDGLPWPSTPSMMDQGN